MIYLSYTTLNDLITCPHSWLCRQMGLSKKTFGFMTEGKEAHRIIQAHVSGKQLDPRLEKITVKFPIVEETDQDEKTHFEFAFNKKYGVHGYLDGLDLENGRILEIKTSSTPWSMNKFYQLMQWRIYALSNSVYKEAWFITTTRDLKKPNTFMLNITEKDKEKALKYIQMGIDIIESGKFDPTNTKCNYIGCPFGCDQ